MIDSDKEDFILLSDMEVPSLKELLTKQNLYDTELISINSLSKISMYFVRFLLKSGANFYFAAAMRQVLNDAIWAATLKRCIPKGDRKKKAINKRLKNSRPSIGAPMAATRSGVPRVTIIPPRDANPHDEVMVILAPPAISAPLVTVPTSKVATMVVSSLGHSLNMPGQASTTLGATMVPSSSSGPRAFDSSSARGEARISLTQ